MGDLIEEARCRADHPTCNDPALIHRLCDALERDNRRIELALEFDKQYDVGQPYEARAQMRAALNGEYKWTETKGETNEHE